MLILGETHPPKALSAKIKSKEQKTIDRGAPRSAGEAAARTRRPTSRSEHARGVAQRVRSAEPKQGRTIEDRVNEEVNDGNALGYGN